MSGNKDINRLQSRLKLNTFKLESLLEITIAINNNVSKDELFSLYQSILREQLNIGKLILISYNGRWNTEVQYGFDNVNFNIDFETDLLRFKEISHVSGNDSLKGIDTVIPVYHKDLPLAYVLIGDYDEEKIEISPTIKHLPFIQTLTNLIVVAIENKRLAKESLIQSELKKEMEFAREMQNMLFPTQLPELEELNLSAIYLPHHEVGGDYYDFVQINNNEIGFCMADVSGKGVSAALLMSNFQANFRALIGRANSLTELVLDLNKSVLDIAKGERFITFFVGRFNTVTRVLNYVNAAHIPPLLSHNGFVNGLRTGCTGLGMLDEIDCISEGFVKIEPQSYIICYTDGIFDLVNSNREQYGENGLRKFLENQVFSDSNHLNSLLFEELENFKEGHQYPDDVAILTLAIA